MYNRYIPQPDGSFRRNRIPDCSRQNVPPRPQKQETPCPPPEVPCPTPIQQRKEEPKNQPKRSAPPVSAGSFLKQLLPKDLDTGDLIVILLLLLMAGDCQEDQNTALLTLALYLFM